MAELKLDHIAAALRDVETKKKTPEHVNDKNLNDVLTNVSNNIFSKLFFCCIYIYFIFMWKNSAFQRRWFFPP